ncbi:type VII secretion protein EssB [Halobacillus faecis]
MSEVQNSYFRQVTGAELMQDGHLSTVIYQKARLKMQDELEIQVLHDIDFSLSKKIDVGEDEISLTMEWPKSFIPYTQLKQKAEYSRWIFAHQLIKIVEQHKFTRLNLVICPENIWIDSAMTPHFLHYGVNESIPPYDNEKERVIEETKAAVAAAIDLSESYIYYLKFRDTMNVSEDVKEILLANDLDELKGMVTRRIQEVENMENKLVKEPEHKWKQRRNVLRGSVLTFLPVFALVIYAFFFIQPKQEAYLESSERFMEDQYEEVIDVLSPYEVEALTTMTRYQLAAAYVEDVSLSEEQKENIRKTITLEAEPEYLDYWIHIGRGQNEKAVNLAKISENPDLILLALYKLQQEVKEENGLSAEEKEQKLESVQQEIEKYEKEQEEAAKESDQPQSEGRESDGNG